MKICVLFFSILISGILVLGISGCTKEEEEDLTDWSIPRFEKEVVVTEEAEMPEEKYLVKKGDSISAIAKLHGVSAQRLAEANNLELEGSKSIIYPGQKLIIPDVNKKVYYYKK
ncbi:MAG: LysM peptidoglycan-binding domain-containing protein [Nitrospiraceae bacterium]|nr:MAG: LysM peptidoglycan-binding domain-containing protein [Nitrospiraceae bacterium]